MARQTIVRLQILDRDIIYINHDLARVYHHLPKEVVATPTTRSGSYGFLLVPHVIMMHVIYHNLIS